MDKKTLRQYRALKKEVQLLEEKINKLHDRALDVPTVLGKVTASGKDFPYIEEHITVQMDEPKESDEISRLLRIKQARLDQVSALVVEIEEFIAGITDSETRQIFEMSFIDGMKQREIAEKLSIDRSRISRRIDGYLKNAHKAQK